jgi:CRP-like cAMP-binding protein
VFAADGLYLLRSGEVTAMVNDNVVWRYTQVTIVIFLSNRLFHYFISIRLATFNLNDYIIIMENVVLLKCQPGDFFGERALLSTNDLRAATLTSLGESTCFRILEKDIQRVFGASLSEVLVRDLCLPLSGLISL